MRLRGWGLLGFPVLIAGCGGGGDGGTAAAPAGGPPEVVGARALAADPGASLTQLAPMYAADFVATAATGYDLNDAGEVVGKTRPDTGCGPFCLPPEELSVWRGGSRSALPLVAGYAVGSQFPRYVNNQGLIGGVVGVLGSTTNVAAWIPGPGGYSAVDLGVPSGMSSADVAGLDEQGRVVGWAVLGGAIPSAAAPFVWSLANGFEDLAAQGYPNERPAAISPNGSVVTTNSWYQLGVPDVSTALPPLPSGFVGAGSNGSAINDAGDQAHFLVSTSTQNLVYPFRLSSGGSWQQISTFGTGHLSRFAMGSISASQDVTFTAGSTGLVAAGPDGVGQSLAALLSPAYGGAGIIDAGPMNAAGQILGQVMIGRSPRLMKLTPVTPCSADCVVVSSLLLSAQFVEDPRFPGSCIEGGSMYNLSNATVLVTSESGAPLADVQVRGRFLDDYWTDQPVAATTNAAGVATWSYQGLCGVGAIAFLVEDAALAARSFDRSRGVLAQFVIPSTQPAPNQPPIADPVVECSAGKVCSFDGRGSTDPDGLIVAYRWTTNLRKTGALSTEPTFTQTFSKAGRSSIILEVTDNGGLSASKKISFTVLR